MDLREHAAFSAIGAAAIYAIWRQPEPAAAFLVSGVLVDFDHFADYWRDKGFNFRLKEFWGHFGNYGPERLWLFLHAWEWALLTLLAWYFWGRPAWLLGLLAGYVLHLSLDQYANEFRAMGYSIVYRALVGFRSKYIFNPRDGSTK